MSEPTTPRVERHRRIEAPPGRVWRVLEERELRRRMLGGDLDVDLTPGATGTFDDGATRWPVRIDRAEPPRRLAFEWGEGDAASQVDIRLVPAGDGTDVHVTETRGRHGAGSRACLSEPTALALAA